MDPGKYRCRFRCPSPIGRRCSPQPVLDQQQPPSAQLQHRPSCRWSPVVVGYAFAGGAGNRRAPRPLPRLSSPWRCAQHSLASCRTCYVIPPKAGPHSHRLPRRLHECSRYHGGAIGSPRYNQRRGMRPLRDRRSNMAAVRQRLHGFLDGARAVHDAGRGEALRVERHERARRRAGGVVCCIAAALSMCEHMMWWVGDAKSGMKYRYESGIYHS